VMSNVPAAVNRANIPNLYMIPLRVEWTIPELEEYSIKSAAVASSSADESGRRQPTLVGVSRSRIGRAVKSKQQGRWFHQRPFY